MSWPAHNRYVDIVIAIFYILALQVIYLIEIEQLVIADPSQFSYPVWPPAALVDLTHWWGENYHGALYYRPAWYKATIWVDVLFSGPVYAAGVYAFVKKRAWIKYPALIQASVLCGIVFISMFEEIWGIYAGDQKAIVIASMLLWMAVPGLIIGRCIQIRG